MSSKRGLAGKRAVLPRRSDHTKGFLKDWRRLGRLAFRECHAGGDLLLMYGLRDDFVINVRAGTHLDLFD